MISRSGLFGKGESANSVPIILPDIKLIYKIFLSLGWQYKLGYTISTCFIAGQYPPFSLSCNPDILVKGNVTKELPEDSYSRSGAIHRLGTVL
jgi:hypothetical protein